MTLRELGSEGLFPAFTEVFSEELLGGGGRILDIVRVTGDLWGSVSGAVIACERGMGLGPLSRSGLPRWLDLGEIRSSGGRGDMGTFQRLASSGRSSSESWYSASSSCIDLRLGCHELRRAGRGKDDRGDTGPGRRLWFVVVMAEERRAGDVERVRGSEGLGKGSEFMEGLVKVLLAKLLSRGGAGSVVILALFCNVPAI
jgi:hypothetical protein